REGGRDRPACKEVEDLFQVFCADLNAFAGFVGSFALLDGERNCGFFRGSFANDMSKRYLSSCFFDNADEVKLWPAQNKSAVRVAALRKHVSEIVSQRVPRLV